MPSVQAMSLKECPAPAARTLRPRADARTTAAESSSIDAGRSMTAGAQRSSPAQFCHEAAALCGSLGSLIR